MFRITGFVDDRNLAVVMRFAAGKILNFQVVPVANGKAENGKVEAEAGSAVELFAQWIKKNKLTELRADDARRFTTEIGRAERSYSHFLAQARDAGLLRKTGEGTHTVWKVKGVK